ncbi:ABC-type polysaccharide/polyol phosphate export permease [Hydrocarboniphaga daqingensis]|uniref:ABC-type polysaccharide/polyol phosphate export permease n=2 Tax=Hydrocarboniphaga daqingensis TaxID=490188 RepID=A0A1M5N671_9GAMM|nr:ABC-type polysaccharide/polyol phosphate export permease [Hydrocarboniphaga daqingensis]
MRVIGHLDRVSPREIRGWAMDAEGDGAPLSLDVKINGVPYKTILADRLRADVKAKGLHPTGLCGFFLAIPEGEQLQASDLVSVRPVGAERDLSGSPALCKGAEHQTPAPPPQSPTPSPPAATAAATETGQPKISSAVLTLPELPPLPPPPQRNSLRIFADSFTALFLRQMKLRYGSQRFGYFLAIAEPLFYMALLRGSRMLAGRGGGKFGGEEGGVDGFYYHSIGVISFFIFIRVFNSCMGSISAAKGIFSYRQVRPIDAVLVAAVIELMMMLALKFVIVFVLLWIGRPVEADNLLGFFAAIGLLFSLALGLGLWADVYITKNQEIRRFVDMMNRPLLFLSGAFFTMEQIPDLIAPYIIWNPILHGVDLARGEMLSAYDSPGSWVYIGLWTLFSLWIGFVAYRKHLSHLTN